MDPVLSLGSASWLQQADNFQQSTAAADVDTLLAESFKALCSQDIAPASTQSSAMPDPRFQRVRADSFNAGMMTNFGGHHNHGRLRTGSGSSTSNAITDLYTGGGSNTLARSKAIAINRAAYSHGTLPRNHTNRLVRKDSSGSGSNSGCANCGQHGSTPGTPTSYSPSASFLHLPPTTGLPSSPLHMSPQGTSTWSRTMHGHTNHQQQDSPVRRLSFSRQHSLQQQQQHQVDNDIHRLPAGFAELESRYQAMKNLSSPLPNALFGGKMPAVYPLNNNSDNNDQDYETCSVMGDIPPPPPPVQSHAVLESGLGHELPAAKTPGTMRKIEWTTGSNKPPNLPLPPLPPKRTSSRLSDMINILRPNNLNVSNDSDNSIYSRPKPFTHRSSLMSTGSSDSGGSSGPNSDQDLPMSPLTPSSELVFSWPNYMISSSPDPHNHSHNQRSVSRGYNNGSSGEDAGSEYSGGAANSANTSMTSHSGVYVKMHPVFSPDNPDSPYMNLLYSAVQQQGGTGSVECAMSPYLAMTGTHFNNNNNIKSMASATIDSVSAIYAQIDSHKGSDYEISDNHAIDSNCKSPLTSPAGKKIRVRPASRSSTNKSKALAEFRELMMEVERKRNFRVGLNLFNTRPDLGIDYMVKQGFLELSPLSVAKFLHATSDLARSKVGEYISELHNAFSMKVLSCYLEKFDFAGMRVDKALRQFLHTVQIPGEPQKIEKIMEMFGKRFNKCNPNFANKLKNTESIATLCVAIMLLNTDIHTPDLKPDKKLIEKDFYAQLKGADGGRDFDKKLLSNIYKSVKKQEFATTPDHVAQTQLLRSRVSGKAPHLSDPHRRLVCLCRLTEVTDINSKKEGDANNHQRDIWLFNDMLLVTKASGKTNSGLVYSYRDSFYLTGLEVTLFHTPVFRYGIQLSRKSDGAVLSTLNAASEQDRYKFVMDLQESIFEMDMMGRALQAANIAK